MVLFFLIALFIANATSYRPDGSDKTTRRIWFWVFAALTPVVGFLINFLVANGIELANEKSSYLTHAGIAAGIALELYIIIGLVISKIFSRSKVSTWF